METLVRYERQSEESFVEQKEAISFNVQQINKYQINGGRESMIYTKML